METAGKGGDDVFVRESRALRRIENSTDRKRGQSRPTGDDPRNGLLAPLTPREDHGICRSWIVMAGFSTTASLLVARRAERL